MPVSDPTQRFSSRVDHYGRYRPGYPPEVLQVLRAECGLTPASVIADIASGTGIFTRILLENGNRVFGVEPNPEMRQAGEIFLEGFSQFNNVSGTAEATGLPLQSVDFVTAAQAAHWFDLPKARQEFVRILKPKGWAVLLWNERRTDSTSFLRDYEQLLLDYGVDYKDVRHELTTARIHEFFAPSPFETRAFEICQQCDYEGLEGRLLSSSYVPEPDHANYQAMLQELRRIFAAHRRAGCVSLDYDTRVYYGRLS